MRNSFILILIVAFGIMLYGLFDAFSGNEQLSELAKYYAQKENIEKVQAANLVTAVVVTYRGLDTLGEVTILFLTAAIIGFFLHNKEEKRFLRENSEIFITAAKLLIPIIILLGVYIFINGHLTPGGGFQGGAVIASAVILMILAFPEREFNSKFFTYLESASGTIFVLLAALGAIIGSGFLDNAIVPMGTFGKLVSAGVIPIIYSFVGLKVGSELSNILGNFKAVQSDN
ncbi:MAG: hypothetical protein B6I20_11175 [Bacteroidetes bacterium 4572_117]|nr:MAG: hypothetical protein B6I20_11175 [Bacteroidetes bacterium 4572_117]